jgi:integrase
MNTVVQLRPSQSEKPTVRGGRAKNADYRQREYLTEGEIAKLLDTAGNSRNPTRDRLLILMAFRHALRVSELVDIRWEQIDLDTASVHIRRAETDLPSPITGQRGWCNPDGPARGDPAPALCRRCLPRRIEQSARATAGWNDQLDRCSPRR